MTTGERIKSVREKLGITQEDFAKKIGTKRNTITNYEANRREPMDATIRSICREFDVNEHWLRTGEGEMFIQKSRSDEISAFLGDVLRGEPDFRQRFISVLARMTPEEWAILEKKVMEIADEMKKAGP